MTTFGKEAIVTLIASILIVFGIFLILGLLFSFMFWMWLFDLEVLGRGFRLSVIVGLLLWVWYLVSKDGLDVFHRGRDAE